MNILAIDIGSYSLKFIEGRVDRKVLHWINAQEVIIDEVRDGFDETTELELQAHIISLYIQEAKFEGKIILLTPSSSTTNRFLHLPVTSKKKAELMIPFQLEEDLPFPGSETHFAAQYLKTDEGYYALVSASLLNDFDKFFKVLEKFQIESQIITSELSLMQSWICDVEDKKSLILLDMGHETTKMYSFHDNAVSASHISYVAGKKIEKNIAGHYDITEEEARVFKHQNAYLLTSDQFEKVDQDQSDFGQLMDKTFAPLVSEINRLILGHRIQHGSKISKIYLTGGPSRIKNIEKYYEEKLGIKVERLQFVHSSVAKKYKINEDVAHRLGNCHLLSKSIAEKKNLMNFRSGEYSSNAYEDLPLHSTAFIGVRAAMLSIVLIAFLMVERFLINSDIKKINKNVTKVLKNPTLNISRKDRLFLKKSPEKVQKKLARRKAKIENEVKIIESTMGFNSTLAIDKLGSKVRKDLDFHLLKYSHKKGNVYARFQLKDEKNIKALEKSFQNLNLKSLKIDINKKQKQIAIQFKEPYNG